MAFIVKRVVSLVKLEVPKARATWFRRNLSCSRHTCSPGPAIMRCRGWGLGGLGAAYPLLQRVTRKAVTGGGGKDNGNADERSTME